MTVTLLLPRDGARHIAAENAGRSGRFWINHARADGLMVVSAVKTAGARYQVKLEPKHHPLNSAADSGGSWPWFQVAVDLHWGWEATIKRFGAAVSREAFDRYLTQKLKDPGNTEFLVLTYAPEFDEAQYEELHAPPFAAWWVSRDGARGVPVAVEPESTGIDQLRPHWPVADLAGVTVMVVGVGSIGGAAAAALAGYGVGRLRLVDPDRLMWHNLVRHVLPVRHVGRHKVDGLRDHLEQHRPDVSVEALRLDVVDDADQIRALLTDTDIVLCCADGVGPRRVVSHLARRAGRPPVLACVLDDGGIGEICGCFRSRTTVACCAGGKRSPRPGRSIPNPRWRPTMAPAPCTAR